MTDERSQQSLRALKAGEEKTHLEMLNLAFAPWGDEKQWKRKYRQPGFDVAANVLVVEQAGHWAGGATAWFREACTKNGSKVKVYTVGDLYVHPNFRGKGVSSTAMRGLNELAKQKGAALAFTFPSVYRLTSTTLPKYGFVSLMYPKARILILNPDKFLKHLFYEMRLAHLPDRFNGMRIEFTIQVGSGPTRKAVSKLLKVANGTLVEFQGPANIDLKVRMDIADFLKLSSKFLLGRRAFLLELVSAWVRGTFRARFSLDFIRAFLGFARTSD